MDAGTDRSTPAGSRRWPSGLIGMLALLVVVERGVMEPYGEYGTIISADWKRERKAATSGAVRKADILCFGDSLIKTGVVPAALEARLDLTAYNLAGMNAPAPANYVLLKRALGAGARPRAIIFDAHEAQLWGSRYRDDVASWAGLLGPAEAWSLARDNRDLGLFGLYLVHLLPSVQFRLDVRNAVGDRLHPDPNVHRVPWADLIERQTRRNRGAVMLPSDDAKKRPDPYADGVIPPADWEQCYRWVAFAHPTNLVYLDRFLRLAESRGIPVFFVIPPIHPVVLSVRERLGLEAEYLAFIRRVKDTFANVTVVDGRHAGYDYRQFVDTCHLHYEAATAQTEGLAEVIAPRLAGAGGGRWVALPRFAEPTAHLAVEDLEESRSVVAWWWHHR